MDFKERVRRRCEFDASLVYGTREFNMMTKRESHSQYRESHDDDWLDTKTGVIAEQFQRPRVCPVCGEKETNELFIKSGFPHVKCVNCELVYVTPILTESEYTKLWKKEDSWQSVLETEEQAKMQSLEAEYSLDVALSYCKKELPSVCDIGCGPGRLLGCAKERGFEVFGIEPNVNCQGLLSTQGIPFISDFFPLRKIEQTYDMVFSLNTLEHLPDPKEAVLSIKNILNNDGLLYISVPNIDGLVNRIMHEKGGVFGGHSHIQFFNYRTLSKLVESCGFEVLEYETIISELGVIQNHLDFQDPYFGAASNDKLPFLTPELIFENHLGRNVNLIARLR